MSATSEYFLTSKRLGFRTWALENLELAVGLWGDIEVTKLFDGRGPLSQEQVQARLDQEIASQSEHGVQYWPIFLLETGDHVGSAGLRPYDLSQRIFEIGFHIRSDCWSQGYASEAARAVITYAFSSLKLAGLFAGHNPKNEASRNLLLKLGFRYTHDEFYKPTGLQHPAYLLTEKEYAESQGDSK